MLLSWTEMRLPISLSSGKCTRENSCKRYYIIILYLFIFLFIYLRSLLARSVECDFFSSLQNFELWLTWIVRNSFGRPLHLLADVLVLRFESVGTWIGTSTYARIPRFLMDIEQRGRLIITVSCTGESSAPIPSPCSCTAVIIVSNFIYTFLFCFILYFSYFLLLIVICYACFSAFNIRRTVLVGSRGRI